MELRLRVEPPGDRPRDLAVDVEPLSTTRALVDAVAAHLGLPSAQSSRQWWGYVDRLQVWVGDDKPVADCGIRNGDLLKVTLRDRLARASDHQDVIELVVMDGPAKGTRTALSRGEHVVGRRAPADVIIDDPRMSSMHLRVTITDSSVTVADEQSTNGTFVDGKRVQSPQPVRSGQVIKAGRTLLSLRRIDAGKDDGGGRGAPDSAGSRSAPFDLVVSGGPAAGLRIPLTREQVTIGREAGSADIPLNDPLMSARHLRIRLSGTELTVADLNSTNGSSVDGTRLPALEERPLRPGQLVKAGRSLLSVEPSTSMTGVLPTDREGCVPFNRPPRVAAPYQPTVVRLPAPPGNPPKARLPIAASLFPLLGGAVFFIVSKAASHGQSNSYAYVSVVMLALSPLLALGSFLENRISGRGQFAKNVEAFRQKVAVAEGELHTAHAEEIRARRAAAPDATDLLNRAAGHRQSLWERRPSDHDFLHVRVGTADRPADASIEFEPGGNEALRAEAGDRMRAFTIVPAVPVVVELPDRPVVGISGNRNGVSTVGRWLVTQAAILHSPRDVVIGAAVSSKLLADWEWLKWLPHTQSETSPIDAGHLATDTKSAASLLAACYRVLEQRRGDRNRIRIGATRELVTPYVLLVIDEALAPERAMLSELLAEGGDHGIGVIWLGTEVRDLPGECRAIVEVDAGGARLNLMDATSGVTLPGVAADGLSSELALSAALALAPLRDTGAAKATSGLPRRVMLLDLLEVPTPNTRDVAKRWAVTGKGLEAAVGLTVDGPFTIDLRQDGPHGLIIGTTGSGKSELLQSFVASLALAYPPKRLTFLLIDGKGGAAFKDCAALPHTVGYVTELDPHIARRALISLRAELDHREKVITEEGHARDLQELERRSPAMAPPTLLVIIDEFGALSAEMPEFIDKTVDIGRKGRSLGMHFILATQSSTGVVTTKIRANTNLRVALRTTDASESNDVIEAADAVSIDPSIPGRAYALTGRDLDGRPQLTALQSAFVGGWSGLARARAPVFVADLGFGPLTRWKEGTFAGIADQPTDLQRIIEATSSAAADMQPPRRPWLPLLPTVVPLSTLRDASPHRREPDRHVIVGLLDEPALQRQRVYSIDLETEGSVLVYGGSGSGKTTLLRTLSVSLSTGTSPEEVNLYGLDFGTRGLHPLAALPHCGSIVVGEDIERVEHLFSLLSRTVSKRKELFARSRVSTLSEYRERGNEPLPRLVVLLDVYAAFASAFERVNMGELLEVLPRLVGDGRPLGLHFVISADRRGAVPAALAGLISTRIILAQTSEDEYATFGIKPTVYRGASLPPGRGFVEQGSEVLEMQTAVPGNGASGGEQAADIADIGAGLRAQFPLEAPEVQLLPPVLPRSAIPASSAPFEAILGLADGDLEPVSVDLKEGHFLIAGPYRSGRTTALATLALALRIGLPSAPFHLLAPRRSELTGLDFWTSVAHGPKACDASLKTLVQEVEAREQSDGPLFILIDDGEELAESSEAAALERIVRRGRDTAARIVAAAETQAAYKAYGGWLREIRKDKQGLLLNPDSDLDGDLFGVRLPRQSRRVVTPGRGFLVQRGSVQLMQVAT
jgi:S-DNA-T family DNA segregation ATPase FtsK/SpoIIIE